MPSRIFKTIEKRLKIFSNNLMDEMTVTVPTEVRIELIKPKKIKRRD